MTTTLPSFVRRATRGYNLLEIIVTVTLIGILTAITYSYCPNLISTGQDKNAIVMMPVRNNTATNSMMVHPPVLRRLSMGQ